MGLAAEEKYLLNKLMGPVAHKVSLGDLLDAAYEGYEAPSHRVVAGGTFTTVGGDAEEEITVAGVLATDIVMVSVQEVGGTPRTIASAKAGAGKIDVVLSGDPSTDHVLQYIVYRAL